MNVVINGRAHVIDGRELTYAELVSIAGDWGQPSVTFRSQHGQGILAPGQTIIPSEGTIFNVVHTGNA